MIVLTRLNGEKFAVNVDLIERAETTPDTVIRMTDGSKFVVLETIEEVIDKVTDFKASVLRGASPQLSAEPPNGDPEGRHLRIVPSREREEEE